MKRLFDFVLSFFGLIIFAPIIFLFLLLVWLQDRKSPIYAAKRVGKKGKVISVYKIRSMVANAHLLGGDSTSNNDNRITRLGHFIRNYKIDELLQLWNVFIGNMSFVGPRPTVEKEVALYNQTEKQLLSLLPGITDFSSIVFSDEGEILQYYPDPDLAFELLIKPWKMQLGLFYVNNRNFLMDVELIFLTALSFFSKKTALNRICSILKQYKVSESIIEVCRRESELKPYNGYALERNSK